AGRCALPSEYKCMSTTPFRFWQPPPTITVQRAALMRRQRATAYVAPPLVQRYTPIAPTLGGLSRFHASCRSPSRQKVECATTCGAEGWYAGHLVTPVLRYTLLSVNHDGIPLDYLVIDSWRGEAEQNGGHLFGHLIWQTSRKTRLPCLVS